MATRRIFIIGATGAQGIPIAKALMEDGAYSLRILTRDADSARAKELAALGDVEVIEGTFANEQDLRRGFRGCWGTFVNIDGFNSGEKTEMFWTMRAYELAIEEGIRFYIHGNLESAYKKSGYDGKFRTGHFDAKDRVAEWILLQNQDNKDRMGAAIFTTGPYMEMNFSQRTVMTPTIEDGVVTWNVPIEGGAVPFVALDDCGHYVRWLFNNPSRSNGMDLKVAIDHIDYDQIVNAFTKVTSQPAQWHNVSLDGYFAAFRIPANAPAGYNADPNDPATLGFRDNFSGFWRTFQHSAGNQGLIRRDYALLDEIHPGRIRSAEEWIRKQEEKSPGGIWAAIQPGNTKSVLKSAEDGRQGRL